MRKYLAILAAALALSHPAHAACTKYGADGSVTPCVSMSRPVDQDALCRAGVRLAHDAYFRSVFDARRVNRDYLHYMVDYFGDMETEASDRQMAHKAADHIAKRLGATGMRQPATGAIYEAAREVMVTECNRGG